MVEVADGHNVPAEFSGTAIISTKNDAGENITLCLIDVLHVPNLERKLYSFMSLIDQNHDVKLSKRNGAQIYLQGECFPISINMPNYHLFASSARTKQNTQTILASTMKINFPLELFYMRTGCRSIKTLLSANQENLWQDVNIIIKNDIISDTDHHIETIRKKKRNTSRINNPNLKAGQIICLDMIKNTASSSITPSISFSDFLMAVDVYSCLPKLNGLFGVTTSEIISVLKYIQVQLYNLKYNTEVHLTDRIQADYGTVFTSESCQNFCINNKFKLTLALPKYLEMNPILERTFQSLALIKNSLIVQARVDETFTYVALQYACEIFSIIPVRSLRKNNRITTPYELYHSCKPRIKRFRVLFCPCVIKEYTASIHDNNNKQLNINVSKRFTQKGIRGIFVGFDHHTPGYLFFLPSMRQVVSSIYVIFDEHFLSALVYKTRAYCEALFTRPIPDPVMMISLIILVTSLLHLSYLCLNLT